MNTHIHSTVEKHSSLRLQVNKGEIHRVIHQDVHPGSLWVHIRSNDYCVFITSQVLVLLDALFQSNFGRESGASQGKKWWFVSSKEDLKKAIQLFGECKGQQSPRPANTHKPAKKSVDTDFLKLNLSTAPSSLGASLRSEDEPYALQSIEEQERRTSLLAQPHIAPLMRLLKKIRVEHSEKDMPCFDPCDGGIGAKVLVLFEAPGPKAVGSTFISRNNPDPTARNVCGLMQESNLTRKDTILWNIVPWYVGDGTRIRPVGENDIQEALPYLKQLLKLLPELQVIILSGKKAQSAKNGIRQLTNLPLIETNHPSARVFNVWPHKRGEVKEAFSLAAKLIASSNS